MQTSHLLEKIMEYDRLSLEAWQKDQPLSILQLDAADRAVLRVAGRDDGYKLKAKLHIAAE